MLTTHNDLVADSVQRSSREQLQRAKKSQQAKEMRYQRIVIERYLRGAHVAYVLEENNFSSHRGS